LAIGEIIEGEQQAIAKQQYHMWRAGAVEEDLAIGNIVEGGQQAIGRAAIPCLWSRSRRIGRAAISYMESSSCRKRTWLSVRLEREEQHAIQRARPYESRSCGRGLGYQ
jgi:hypothetical protein